MQLISRRMVLAAGGTLTGAVLLRKPSAAAADGLDRLAPTDPPKPLPEITFVSADGTEHHLEEFRGRGMVINLWATWCAPCVAEMPALASLAKTLAPEDIAVLPLSSDRGGAAAVERFYAAHEIVALPVLLDPKGDAARAWGARGIPTTFIVDKQGRERARIEGAADWASPAAAEKVRALIAA